jgi:hypothetical protein
MSSLWSPQAVFLLADVLASRSLGAVRVGEPGGTVEAHLGAPEFPPARLNRRSAIHVWPYGNVHVLVSGGRIAGIGIDFHGPRIPMVRAGAMEGWRTVAWEEHARRQQWTLRPIGQVVNWVSDGLAVSLDALGALHEVNLRGR